MIGIMINPGSMNCIYGNPLISPKRDPMKFPKMVMYKKIVMTDGKIVCIHMRDHRKNSFLKIVVSCVMYNCFIILE